MVFSILFFIFFLGVPIAMVVLIIVMIKRRRAAAGGLEELSQSRGWRLIKSDPAHPLYGILASGVFSYRTGKDTLSNIIEAGPGFWICDNQHISPGTTGKRRSSYSVLAVGERQDSGPDFWIIRRQEGPLGKLAEALVSVQLHPVAGSQWSWMLTSSPEAFEAAGWADPVPSVLERRMVPGGALFLAGKYIVLTQPGVLDRDRAQGMKEDLEMIRGLL